MKTLSEWTLEDYVDHYVDTIRSPANAWGQHLSPLFGNSQWIMVAAYGLFDGDAFNALVDSKLKLEK